jgi:hypothetical protein
MQFPDTKALSRRVINIERSNGIDIEAAASLFGIRQYHLNLLLLDPDNSRQSL